MIDLTQISGKWQKRWAEAQIFRVTEDPKKKKYYVLEMYPYPSASYLHMGHVRNYTIGDAYARFKRMNGFNVLYPMGYDSFGLPAETAAKKEGIHPRVYTDAAIKRIIEYQKSLGNSYDWDRVIASHDVDYYRWNQYFFTKFFERGLVYRKKAPVNWCPTCESTLANEEAEGGKCWRCGNDVIQKDLEQWFFRITAYADRLLEDLSKIDWPEKIKTMQTNWIGKSYGTEIEFTINGEKWPVFTTRPDTLYGVTFMVISAQHPRLKELVTAEHRQELEEFQKRCQKVKTPEEMEGLEKDGVFIGAYAINPINGERIPVYAGNFVIADYGCGMVMAVPAHDERDFEFARKYNIPIKTVIEPITGILQENEEFRKSIVALVRDPKSNEILTIDWGDKLGGTLLIGGGVSKDEDEIECAKREILEETGYKNVKFIGKTQEKIHHHYRAHSKEVNHYIHATGLYFELTDEQRIGQKLEADEKNKFNVRWLGIEKAEEKIKDPLHKYVFDKFMRPSAYIGEGLLISSSQFDGIDSKKAIAEITDYLEQKRIGKRIVQYKIRDWMISRQRYWGTPIPMIHCEKCGVVPVPEKDLPVVLPENVDFKSSGNPLAKSQEFVSTTCPKCNGPSTRDTDTMGGFMDSSWYFLRYCDSKSKDLPFDPAKVKYWMPVDQYIGGAEHAVMHLLYARFFIKALKDMGMVDFDEPFAKLFNQGILYKDGAKMSKSKGNVIYQTDISDRYGIDTARLFLMFIAAPDKLMEWSDQGVEGAYRFLNKVIALMDKERENKIDRLTSSRLNRTIREVTENIDNFQYNKAIISIMDLTNNLSELEKVPAEAIKTLALILSPFTPHLSEEMWEMLGEKPFISLQRWPKADEKSIDDNLEAAQAAIALLPADISKVMELAKLSQPRKIKLIISPNWKYDFYRKLKVDIEVTRDMRALMTKYTADKAFSQYAADISRIIPSVLKDQSKLPSVITSQADEHKLLEEARPKLSERFGADIILELAEKSTEQKAKNGIPGKPAIVIE
jgi:leucyl-tRNA synthetase